MEERTNIFHGGEGKDSSHQKKKVVRFLRKIHLKKNSRECRKRAQVDVIPDQTTISAHSAARKLYFLLPRVKKYPSMPFSN